MTAPARAERAQRVPVLVEVTSAYLVYVRVDGSEDPGATAAEHVRRQLARTAEHALNVGGAKPPTDYGCPVDGWVSARPAGPDELRVYGAAR